MTRDYCYEHSGLSKEEWLAILATLTQGGPRIADIFVQHCQTECWALEDGRVSQVSIDQDAGVGLRRVEGMTTSYAVCEQFDFASLQGCAQQISPKKEIKEQSVIGNSNHGNSLDLSGLDLPSVEQCLSILHHIDKRLHAIDPRIIKVTAGIVWRHNWVMIITEDGQMHHDYRPMVRVSISCVAEEKGARESAHAGGGGSGAMMAWLDMAKIDHYIDECARQALLNLGAADAPAGEMPVILGSGWPGVLLHEAVGHGLEADYNRKGSSAYSGRLGQQVASPCVTVVDDGTIATLRGSIAFDDEGTPSARNVLIEDGVLRSYMNDRYNAELMSVPLTGNGRRESYHYAPMPRMTNTFMLPNEQVNLDEMLAGVDRGLYAVNFSGGQVDITSGQFVFTTQEAYLVENGRVTKPVKRATLLGHGPSVLEHISAVGDDFAHDAGVGTCGKQGQSVPVTVGQPSLKVDRLTVGGVQ